MPLKCKICGSPLLPVFKKTVLGKHEARYNFCEGCGFLCAENPHWLEEAYSSAIVSTDTGLVVRNVTIAGKLAAILYFIMGERGDGRYVDVAGGYGMLTRLMRDYGFDFYWSDKYCENLLARGFESIKTSPPFAAITAFEALEHIHDPLAFIKESLSESGTKTIIFSSELYEGEPPRPDEWWYYAFNTGQHISFYQKKTLHYIADNMGLHLYTNGFFHMLTDKTVNLFGYKILTGRFSNALSRIVRRNMQSKTFSDHERLMIVP